MSKEDDGKEYLVSTPPDHLNEGLPGEVFLVLGKNAMRIFTRQRAFLKEIPYTQIQSYWVSSKAPVFGMKFQPPQSPTWISEAWEDIKKGFTAVPTWFEKVFKPSSSPSSSPQTPRNGKFTSQPSCPAAAGAPPSLGSATVYLFYCSEASDIVDTLYKKIAKLFNIDTTKSQHTKSSPERTSSPSADSHNAVCPKCHKTPASSETLADHTAKCTGISSDNSSESPSSALVRTRSASSAASMSTPRRSSLTSTEPLTTIAARHSLAAASTTGSPIARRSTDTPTAILSGSPNAARRATIAGGLQRTPNKPVGSIGHSSPAMSSSSRASLDIGTRSEDSLKQRPRAATDSQPAAPHATTRAAKAGKVPIGAEGKAELRSVEERVRRYLLQTSNEAKEVLSREENISLEELFVKTAMKPRTAGKDQGDSRAAATREGDSLLELLESSSSEDEIDEAQKSENHTKREAEEQEEVEKERVRVTTEQPQHEESESEEPEEEGRYRPSFAAKEEEVQLGDPLVEGEEEDLGFADEEQ